VRRSHLPLLACPQCSGPLHLAESRDETDDRIAEGQLGCHGCGRAFPITRHIPRFVPVDNYAKGFGYQWSRHARTQLDSYTRAPISERRFFEATRWPRALQGDTILEVGSGAGRFTEQAASTGATVVSVDYSQAVEANFATNGWRDNVLIVQGDIYHLPVPTQSVDRVFCFGVLQHTPDVRASFFSLVPPLKPGGSIAIDVYRKPQGLQRLWATRYMVRSFTAGRDPERLYAVARRYVETAWPLARQVARIPKVGTRINWLFLIADYSGTYDLSDELLKEWAILDTFDMISPAYDSPQTLEVVRRWFDEAHLIEVEVHYGHNGIEGRGRKP
jgi:uncharacterized protein YbaR (Trm112 family)/ubiquinone/menaquinone biosynthesis C-methylase UbiE